MARIHELAEIYGALADATRLRILGVLSDGRVCGFTTGWPQWPTRARGLLSARPFMQSATLPRRVPIRKGSRRGCRGRRREDCFRWKVAQRRDAGGSRACVDSERRSTRDARVVKARKGGAGRKSGNSRRVTPRSPCHSCSPALPALPALHALRADLKVRTTTATTTARRSN